MTILSAYIFIQCYVKREKNKDGKSKCPKLWIREWICLGHLGNKASSISGSSLSSIFHCVSWVNKQNKYPLHMKWPWLFHIWMLPQTEPFHLEGSLFLASLPTYWKLQFLTANFSFSSLLLNLCYTLISLAKQLLV